MGRSLPGSPLRLSSGKETTHSDNTDTGDAGTNCHLTSPDCGPPASQRHGLPQPEYHMAPVNAARAPIVRWLPERQDADLSHPGAGPAAP
jgi:hypothetical protein